MLNKNSFRLLHLKNKEEKLAWLAEEITSRTDRIMVVCFDKEESEMVQNFLQHMGIASGMLNVGKLCNMSNVQKREMQNVKDAFLQGTIKVLITVFGYSVDLSGLQGRVDHLIFFERPMLWKNMEALIKECGNENKTRYTILLPFEWQKQDKYYREKCANQETTEAIFHYFQEIGLPASEKELQGYINKSTGEIRYSLVAMEQAYCIFKNDTKYCYAAGDYPLVAGKVHESWQMIQQQKEKMEQFCESAEREEFCGDTAFYKRVLEVQQFFCKTEYKIVARKLWPCGFKLHGLNKVEYPYQTGIAIAQNRNLGFGIMLAKELEKNQVSGDFIQLLIKKTQDYVRNNQIRWITYIEEDSDCKMAQIANQLGKRLGIFVAAPITVKEEIGMGHNPIQECHYVSQKYQFDVTQCYRDNYLILKRNAGSRYDLAYCCNQLGMIGCGKAFPCTLFLAEEENE